MPDTSDPSPLSQIVAREIANTGPITFARFMELALYCPIYGFYERNQDTTGRFGHFYTSVSTGSLFGQLLAFQFAEWLAAPGSAGRTAEGIGSKFQIVEAGAHDGRLAGDILAWIKSHRPGLFERLEYIILEPSSRRRVWQEKTLASFSPTVSWHDGFGEHPAEPSFTGIIFSNELLDAMPVHRMGWDATAHVWYEWGVGFKNRAFDWIRMPLEQSKAPIPAVDPELLKVLPNGYILDVSPAAEKWWRRAAKSLVAGKLLTFDYGFTAQERFLPARTGGTLRAYFRHQSVESILADPGGQDITANVDFAAMEQAGSGAGLRTEIFTTQAQFLTAIAATLWKQSPPLTGEIVGFGLWDSSSTRQFQTLTHPDHLGRQFKVLMQSR